MGDGQRDADGPAGRRPLPPEDRVWRHPAEVALDARRELAKRRARRLRGGATILGGAIAVTGIVWIGRPGAGEATDDTLLIASAEPTESVRAEAASQTSVTTVATTTPDAADPPALVVLSDEPATETIAVRSLTGEILAGATAVREGYVVTSGVALGAAEEVVITWGDTQADGTVIGTDTVTDVTVIRVNGPSGPTPAADVGEVRVREGDEVNMSTADGIRAVQRVVAEQSTSAMVTGEPVIGIVELDGRLGDVSPGTPAYDRDGRVVGMTTATADRAPAAIVPIDLARQVADEIIATGGATHPWLGITARDPDDESGRPGSLVTEVTADGPAAAAGMLPGDLIVAIGGHGIDGAASMVATLRAHEPGETVDVVVWRHDEEITCRVALVSHLDVAA